MWLGTRAMILGVGIGTIAGGITPHGNLIINEQFLPIGATGGGSNYWDIDLSFTW